MMGNYTNLRPTGTKSYIPFFSEHRFEARACGGTYCLSFFFSSPLQRKDPDTEVKPCLNNMIQVTHFKSETVTTVQIKNQFISYRGKIVSKKLVSGLLPAETSLIPRVNNRNQ